MKILVTGTAGFIGYHTVCKLVKKGYDIMGLDNINDYYDVNLKYGRLKETGIDKYIEYAEIKQSIKYKNYKFIKLNLEDTEKIKKLFETEKFDRVIHLAAQAGVRYSIENPYAYVDSNILGFLNILEGCRHNNVEHLTYASSSSVYGLNKKQPFSVSDNVDHPVSLYAATKKSNELMAHTYSYLFKIPVTGLRFFTVYGPWGRPDMAPYLFTKAIYEGKAINVYNYGDMERDFTYIDDIVEGIIRVDEKPPEPDNNFNALNPNPSSSEAPYKIYNIGNSNPVKLMDFIKTIENKLGKKAKMNMMPIQPGDVKSTYADVSDLINNTGYKPNTPLEKGIETFVNWYVEYVEQKRAETHRS